MTGLKFDTPILINLPMPIETDRLIIREPRAGDGAEIHNAKKETWDMLAQWMPWADKIGTVDETEMVIRQKQAEFITREDLMMVVFDKESGNFVGGTGLHRFDWKTRIVEIGYWYRKSAHGKGYATEATKALIRYAFDVVKANKMIICHADGNENSKRVIERCGLTLEYTTIRDDALPSGELVDHHIYSCFNADHLSDFNVTWGADKND